MTVIGGFTVSNSDDTHLAYGPAGPSRCSFIMLAPAASPLRPLNNLVVLFTAFTAFFYLKTRFKMVHYAGRKGGWMMDGGKGLLWMFVVISPPDVKKSVLASKEPRIIRSETFWHGMVVVGGGDS